VMQLEQRTARYDAVETRATDERNFEKQAVRADWLGPASSSAGKPGFDWRGWILWW
jgi:hypothetical protein